jgi:hypothetical protein
MLKSIYLANNIHCSFEYSGIDSFDFCFDKTHFKNYPHKVSYSFNSRGFRDNEWPKIKSELQSSIWCIGDSFTVGLGSPVEHTWPSVLRETVKRNTINLGSDGASNEWIAKTCANIISEVNPECIVLCWSYSHRRYATDLEPIRNEIIKNGYADVKDNTWPVECNTLDEFNKLPLQIRQEILTQHRFGAKFISSDDFKLVDLEIADDLRRIWHAKQSDEQDLENLLTCIQKVENYAMQKVIHAFIPKFCPLTMQSVYKNKIAQIIQNPIYIERLDIARDGHHFDIQTSKNLAESIQKLI